MYEQNRPTFPPPGDYQQYDNRPPPGGYSGGYPPPQGGNPGEYTPPQGGYAGGYPPPQVGYGGGYPPPQGGYAGGYPNPQGGYRGGYPPPQGGYPPPPGAYPGYPPPSGARTPTEGYPGYPMMPSGRQPPDLEQGNSDDLEGFDFTDKSIRMGFIRKVYGILAVQMAFTVSIVAVFLFHEGTRQFVARNKWLWFVALGTTFVTVIMLSCCGDFRRKSPMNYICLGIFTLAEGFLLGCMTLRFGRDEVFYAAVITLVVVVALTIFAFQTSIDFTVIGGVLFVALIILLVFGIFCLFFPGKIQILIYASFGALLFSVYLVYDTQMMMGGKHKYSISPEDYVFAALNLYMDIVSLFIYILTIIGILHDD